MKPTSLPKYVKLSQALNKTTLKLHPSQAHGLICGILCAPSPHEETWQSVVTGSQTTGQTHKLLQNLYDASAHLLGDFLVEFQLILPADSQELPQRAEALTLWCQGFLTGLKLVNIPLINREPSEVTEAINDIIEIAKINHEEVVANEEDEIAYTELVEFIRIAVILIHQDLKKDNASSPQACFSGHLH
ncbi:MAG TPA: YecA family protein [Gammaproteobacteria bacterium]|nr:YecA family protein [Gammaproteobacteria bacterium]